MPHRVRSPDDPTARMRLAARAGKLTVLQSLRYVTWNYPSSAFLQRA